MRSYYVQGSDGRFYGPASVQELDAWASEGRVLAQTVLVEVGTNRQTTAGQLPELHHHFMFAPKPGVQPSQHAAHPLATQAPYQQPFQQQLLPRVFTSQGPFVYPRRRKSIAALLSFFLGIIGAHRFYLGHSSTGMLMIAITILGYFFCKIGPIITAVWSMLDLVNILTGNLRDSNGQSLD